MSNWFDLLVQVSVLAYALTGGVFLAFSDFIMRALAQTSDAGGVEAMQAINRTVFRWIFMSLFLGLLPVSLLLGGYSMLVLEGQVAVLIGLGAAIYVLGCFAVTVIFNVPLNTALADMALSEPATLEFWSRIYVPRWTFWNSVRTCACGLSAVVMLGAVSIG